VERIQAKVLGWYAKHGRGFVWRTPSPDPYVVLVSEVMLQQTQTARVQERLPRFLDQFPDFAALAAADNATVIRAWQGMGYNNRALRLRDCARVVVQQYQGSLPGRRLDLEQLPGLGPYTVGAILSFAFHRDTVVLDVNIRRLYSRLFLSLATTTDTMPEPLLRHVAEQTYPRGRSSDWHQACMDIAAEFCTAHGPRCLFCPVAETCCSAFRLVEAVAPRVAEPSHRGRPNRIWRGRVVEMLRGLPPGEVLDLPALMDRLLETPNENDTPWLESIIAALVRDGIVEFGPHGQAIRLRS
jgi:A/G-specific adenine glycosylase